MYEVLTRGDAELIEWPVEPNFCPSKAMLFQDLSERIDKLRPGQVIEIKVKE